MSMRMGESQEERAARAAAQRARLVTHLKQEAEESTDAPAPSSRARGTTARDLGDAVADLLDARAGRTSEPVASHENARAPAPALRRPVLGPSRDIGDEVADRIELLVFGKIRST